MNTAISFRVSTSKRWIGWMESPVESISLGLIHLLTEKRSTAGIRITYGYVEREADGRSD